MSLKIVQELDVKNKTVLLRVDLNVPMVSAKISDTKRITAIIPTIEYLLSQNAKIVLLSHFGRPKGKIVPDMSLAPLVDELSKILGKKEIKFSRDCIGESAREAVKNTKCGEIILMENLRFYAEEEANNSDFAKELAMLGDIYVNDSFSCSHRAHASITAITKYLPSAAGLLLQDELLNLETILNNPGKPIAAIIGGAKISGKLELLNSLLSKVDYLIIGGAMANSFLKAKGYNIGKSLYEENLINTAQNILLESSKNNCTIILPEDVVVAKSLDESHPECMVVASDQVENDYMILDLGPMTVQNITTVLSKCQTLIWNGPLGAFEYKPYDIATNSVARIIAALNKAGKITTVAGGGDTVSALNHTGLTNNISYLSTGGGAFLEWLQGDVLPGVTVLKI